MASEQEIALLLIDLDQFNEINQRFGRQAGDLLLRRVGERLRGNVRSQDRVARLGGDEFAVFHTGAPAARQAAELADRLLRRLAEPYDLDGVLVTVGASIGISCGDGDSADPQEMVTDADRALRHAKSGGRGAFCIYEPWMGREEADPAADARILVEADG